MIPTAAHPMEPTMTSELDMQRLHTVFRSRPDMIAAIQSCADSPEKIWLFNEIASHVYDQLQSHRGHEPEQKKRKLAEGGQGTQASDGQTAATAAAHEAILLEIKEISVVVPQRKKLDLCFTTNYLFARAPGLTVPIPSMNYSWKEIEFAFFLPIPDKVQAQHYYILFPKGTYLPSKAHAGPSLEPLVFIVPSISPKKGTISGSDSSAALTQAESFNTLFHWVFNKCFKSVGNSVDIISAVSSEFQSVNSQTLRLSDTIFHVRGFRGSKDGYLFFLENGIFWGFKKPILFLPIYRIAAISYTNILQFTFNMVIDVFTGDYNETLEIEFGMLDQQDYERINNFLKANHLQDQSMAEQRRAKMQLAENQVLRQKQQAIGPNSGVNDIASVDGPDEGLSELERAQLEEEGALQAEEDEDEEDYNPDSDGESDGSGSSSEVEGSDRGSLHTRHDNRDGQGAKDTEGKCGSRYGRSG